MSGKICKNCKNEWKPGQSECPHCGGTESIDDNIKQEKPDEPYKKPPLSKIIRIILTTFIIFIAVAIAAGVTISIIKSAKQPRLTRAEDEIATKVYETAQELIKENDLPGAIKSLRNIPTAFDQYENASRLLIDTEKQFIDKTIELAEQYAFTNNYSQAIIVIENALITLPNNSDLTNLISSYQKSILLTEINTLTENKLYADALEMIHTNIERFEGDLEINLKKSTLESLYEEQVLIEADTALQTQGYTFAISVLEKGLLIYPESKQILSKLDAMKKEFLLERAASFAEQGDYRSSITTILDQIDTFSGSSDKADLQFKISEYSEIYATQILAIAETAQKEEGYSKAINLLEEALFVVNADSLSTRLTDYKTAALFSEIDLLYIEGKYDSIIIALRDSIQELGELPALATKLTEMETTYRNKVLADTDKAIKERNIEYANELIDNGLTILPGDGQFLVKKDEIPGLVEVLRCYLVKKTGWIGYVYAAKCVFQNNSDKHVKSLEYVYLSYNSKGFPVDVNHKVTVGPSSNWRTEFGLLPKESSEYYICDTDYGAMESCILNRYGVLIVKTVTFYDGTYWENPNFKIMLNRLENKPLYPLEDYEKFYTN